MEKQRYKGLSGGKWASRQVGFLVENLVCLKKEALEAGVSINEQLNKILQTRYRRKGWVVKAVKNGVHGAN